MCAGKVSVVEAEEFDWISRWMPTLGDFTAALGSQLRVSLGSCDGSRIPAGQFSWYGLRTWIECGFKDFKLGLCGWQQSKLTRASHIEQLWLALALAQS